MTRIDTQILPKTKVKNRKARYTFPNELDDQYENVVKQKRRHSMPPVMDDDFGSYNEKHIIITKNADGVKKELFIKKYTKVHPSEDPDGNNDTNNDNVPSIKYTQILKGISRVAIKIIYYVCFLSCIVL